MNVFKEFNTLNDLVGLVREMRTAQKQYFATRSKEALTRSKNLEKRVDKAISDLTGGAA